MPATPWTDERTVLYKTESLDGTKPNTNPETNPITNPIRLFHAFFEHRPLIFSLAKYEVVPLRPAWKFIINLYSLSMVSYGGKVGRKL